ncbi:MAG: class I tRNA ligase family protein, partial [Chloroflexota bacterium]
GLWPFSTLGWPDDEPDYRTYYPTSVMETGYDILFFWVARMMMLGLQLTDREPFHTVYLSGLIRDPLGQKMSKTKGNVVDPLSVIDESGADALRFAVIHGTTPGNDQKFGAAKLAHARNFANKLWNATRFVVGARPLTIPEDAERRVPDDAQLGPAERWLLSRAAATTQAVDEAMAGLAFGEVTRLVYDAIWNEYCDWGLEFAKVRLADDRLGPDEREATWWTLVEVLDTYLRLLHPVMPFITEALWASLPHRATDPELLIVARWPGVGERHIETEVEVGTLIDLVGEIRNARASAKLPAAEWLETLVYVPIELGPTFEALRPGIERLARARPLRRELTPEALEATTRPSDLSVIVSGGEIEVAVRPSQPDAGANALERDRLERDLAEAEGWLAAARKRLANESFVSRAPGPVVDAARAREAELDDHVAKLRDRLGR